MSGQPTPDPMINGIYVVSDERVVMPPNSVNDNTTRAGVMTNPDRPTPEQLGELRHDYRVYLGSGCNHCALTPSQAAVRLSDAVPVLLDRVTQLETALADLRDHGLRADMRPTMDFSSPIVLYNGFADYLARLDGLVRSRAAAALEA